MPLKTYRKIKRAFRTGRKIYRKVRKMFGGKSRTGFKRNANNPKSGMAVSGLRISDFSGRPEMEKVRLRYGTTSAFTVVGGAATYLQIKGNSVFKPYPGNTDSAGGQATMFSLYDRCLVYASRISLRLWSDTSGNSEPFRAVIAPCNGSQYTAWSAASNIVTLYDNPNFRKAVYSPGSSMLNLKHACYTPQILFGINQNLKELMAQTATLAQATGADPSSLSYWLVGMQNFAGTTTLDCQIEVVIEYDCVFFRSVGSNMQQ